ncbi:MAG: ornithine cyclodeaminase family protein, partial [Reyranella sp.]|nr:ornithine cyclodeaminase family protein [Reyranella sp.]
MKVLSAAEIDAALDDLALIDRLDGLFRAGCEMPVRHHHPIREPLGPGSVDAMLLLMPAWTTGASGRVGVKVVTVFPDNGRRSLPSIYGQYLLLDGSTGETLALLDGTMLTKRRTACASGLASRYLSRPDAVRLLMIGTGALAPELIRVHAKVRPIDDVAIWGRTAAQAEALAARLSVSLPAAIGRPVTVRAVGDREAAVR